MFKDISLLVLKYSYSMFRSIEHWIWIIENWRKKS